MEEFGFRNIRFRIRDGKVYLAVCGNLIIPEESYELGRFIEVQIAGENKDTHYGNKMICSSEGATLIYESHYQKDNKFFVVQKNDNIRVVTEFCFFDDTDCFSVNTSVTNISEHEIILEEVSSFVLGHIAMLADSDKIYYYRFTQSHHAECQPRIFSLYDAGLFKATPISQKRIGCCNIGSWSTKEELPQGIIENKLTNTFLMFQIESNNSWYYEISDYVDRIYLYTGGANANLGGWIKRLNKNESYKTVTVSYAFGESVDGVISEMTKYRRHIAGKSTPDENLPVIFNEYMHLAWNSPNSETTKRCALSAKEIGAEYYVVDCGWHDEVDGSVIYLYMGEWKESRTRFPEGVKAVSDYVHSLGMKFGLWIEPEIIGIKCDAMLNYYTDDCFIQKNGKRLSIMNRYLLDFRSDKVVKYLSETICRMVKEYGADYIKLDYNQDCGVGTDYNADSAGEGLEEAAAAYLAWVDSMREQFPEVLFENCSSGGMRIDYKTMSHFSIASTSDQTDYRLYPYIAANIFSAVLPEQAAVWSYPVGTTVYPENNPFRAEYDWVNENVDDRQVIMNMVNSILGRMHLASHIELLNENKRALIKEGIECYNSIKEFKKNSIPIFPTGFADFHSEFVSCGLKSQKRILLSVWNLSGQGSREIVLDDTIVSANIIYPKKSDVKYKIAGNKIMFCFDEPYQACILDVMIV